MIRLRDREVEYKLSNHPYQPDDGTKTILVNFPSKNKVCNILLIQNSDTKKMNQLFLRESRALAVTTKILMATYFFL